MKKSIRFFLLAAVGISFLLTIQSCSQKSETPVLAVAQIATNPKCLDIKRWRTLDTPSGADSSVSAEEGGAGFEKIAASAGFVTFTPKPEELKFFGDSRAKTGGDFRMIISRYPLSFRPFGYGQSSAYTENLWIRSMSYETLLGIHPVTQELVPALASHWKISDDKKTYTFRIDPNARFWNGKRVTAKDVVATWKLLMDETLNEPSNLMIYGKFFPPKALSTYLVEVKAKGKNWRDILYFGGMSILSADEIGNMKGSEFLAKYSAQVPVGTGEYIILPEDIHNERSYIFTRRDDYWAKQYELQRYIGNFDQILCTVVKDNPTEEYEKFKRGEQDFFRFTTIASENWIKDTAYSALTKNWIRKQRVFTDGSYGTQGYAFNMRRPPFDDIRVRRAFAHLLNRDLIIGTILYSECLPIYSNYSNTVYENPNNEKIPYNPQKATELLAQAGWKTKNADGILTKNGKPFVVEMGIPESFEEFITPFREELKKAGIELKLNVHDQNLLWRSKMERTFDICLINWSALMIPNPETSLSSKLADRTENNNIEGFKNSRVDALCAMYDTTFDRKKQVEIVWKIDSIAQSSVKNLFWWHPRGLRFAYWDRFGMPEWILGRFVHQGNIEWAMMTTWWYDAEKATAVENARKQNSALPKPTETESTYWKKFAM